MTFVEKALAPLSKSQPLLHEGVWFIIKNGWACLFGALLLLAIIATKFWYPDTGLTRYDFLFIYALGIQACLFFWKLESSREIGVILVFHILATGMELFKTSAEIGSWSYPEASFFRIANVPLFTGFMYSAIGSFIARAWRSFHFYFTGFPPLWIAASLAILAYANFFTHHYIPDIRWALIIAGIIAFRKTWIHFKPKNRFFKLPLLISFIAVSFFIYGAENIGTFAKAWQYPGQEVEWQPVHLSKFSAWYLLMQLSFVLIYSLRLLEAKLGVQGPAKIIPGKEI